MLILSRFKNESIMIGDGVEVFVIDVRGDKVRIGINAPSDVAVHRKEIWLRIQSQQKDNGDATQTDEAA